MQYMRLDARMTLLKLLPVRKIWRRVHSVHGLAGVQGGTLWPTGMQPAGCGVNTWAAHHHDGEGQEQT